jgi:hypothetical protein
LLILGEQMKMRAVLISTLLFMVSGCTTIHLDNGEIVSADRVAEKWHHNAVLGGVVEVSDPVNLKSECGNGEWTSVKTELTFINGFASGLVNAFIPIFTWHPKTVEVSCKEDTLLVQGGN